MKILIVLILLFAAVILFWQIHLYPVRLGIYEGLCGLTALKILEGDEKEISDIWDRPRVMRRNMVGTCSSSNRNPFLIYPTALFIKLFGIDRYYITLRASAILYGILSVWMLYLFMGKTFNRGVGLAAAFILATSSWFIGFTRLLQDFSPTIFYSLLCFFVYSISDRGRSPLGYILLGAVLSLGSFFYFPARGVMMVILGAIFIRIFTERGYFKTYWYSLILMVAAFILALRLGGLNLKLLFGLQHSSCEWFWVRYGFHPHDCATPWEYLLTIFKFAYKRFFVDWGWFWDPVCERDACLGPISRYLLLLGIVWSLLRIKDHKHRFLLIWFVVTATPALITQTWFRRSLLVIPAIAALAAVGVYDTFFLLTSWIKKGRNSVLSVLMVAVLLPVAWINLKHYFGLYRDGRYTSGQRKERELRENFVGLLKKYKVYTDIYQAEYGWPQSLQFEAKRLGREGFYMASPHSHSVRSAFQADPGPCALILKTGEVKTKNEDGEIGEW